MMLRLGVGIPTYDNPATLVTVVSSVLENCPFPILIYDDGSKLPVSELLEKSGLKNHPRISLIRSETNRGKGWALRHSFSWAIKQGWTHLLTLDADGQHDPAEIFALAQAALEKPWNLVIGVRSLEGEHVPQASKFGRKFSNFWVDVETDFKVADSQSGFRVYPLFFVQGTQFFTRKFDFEIEVLIRLLWKGVGVSEVPVKCVYPPAHERVSHFNKFRDNVRISILNTVLVALALFRMKQKPSKIGWAVGVGSFIGTSPWIGFHSVIAAGVALVTRLSFPYVWLGTHVSLPPLMPFLIAGSTKIGSIVFPRANFFQRWIVGSAFLGGGLGFALGIAAFFIARRFQKNEPKGEPAWSGRTRGGRFGNTFLRKLGQTFGIKPVYFCLHFIVPYFYVFAPRARRAANEYWKKIQPELGWFQRQRRVHAQLMIFARTLVDRVQQSFSEELLFDFRSTGGKELLDLSRGKSPLVLVGAHVGAWELAALAFRHYKLPIRFTLIRYEAQGMTFQKASGISSRTQAEGIKLLQSNSTVNLTVNPLLQAKEALSEGAPVAMMADRPIGTHFELVPFLGGLAAFDTTPLRVAVACRAQLAFTYGFKGEGKKYHLMMEQAQDYSQLGVPKSELGYRFACDFAKSLEAQLRKHPEQWFNFFSFWSAVSPSAVLSESTQRRMHHWPAEWSTPPKVPLQSEALPPSACE